MITLADYREEILAHGHFVCARCGRRFPLSRKVERDGKQYDTVTCDDGIGPAEHAEAKAAAAALAARDENVAWDWPLTEYLDPVVTGIAPRPANLTRGGAAVAVVLTTVYATSADTIVYGSAGITDASAVVVAADGLSVTLSVQASGGMTQGTYGLTYAGLSFSNVLVVR